MGRSDDDIVIEMSRMRDVEVHNWKEGKCSGAVYHGDDEHLAVLNTAQARASP